MSVWGGINIAVTHPWGQVPRAISGDAYDAASGFTASLAQVRCVPLVPMTNVSGGDVAAHLPALPLRNICEWDVGTES